MKNYLAFIFILCSRVIYAQDFDELISQADAYYEEKSYQQSARSYDQAFAIKEGSYNHYYNAACSWALAGNADQAIKYLRSSADKGWKNKSWMMKDEDLKSLRELDGWQDILTIVQANLDEYERDFDKPLQKQLEAIYVRDQTLRQLSRMAREKFGRESEEMDYIWNLASREDSINTVEVTKIIDERGWPGTSLVGGKANSAVFLVVQHASLAVQEKYLPLLRESVMKGESRGSSLALLEDRILMRNGKPQTYGSQITTDKETGKQIVYKIKDPEYVNKRRAEVGLGPIEEYVSYWDIVWTIPQKD